MVDVVSSQTILDGERIVVMLFTDVSDGTGETGVLKVDVSALNANARGQVCDGVSIAKIDSSLNGMSVELLWDATTDTVAFILAPGVYRFNFDDLQLPNNSGTGKTGDVLFTTIGASAGDTYSIMLTMVKSYAGS